MKKNIIMKRFSGKQPWYTWDEYCNKCGKLIFKSESFYNSEIYDDESDYCTDCLRKKLGFKKVEER